MVFAIAIAIQSGAKAAHSSPVSKYKKDIKDFIFIRYHFLYRKIKHFSALKDTINRVKRQPIEWEMIFANHVSDKGLISSIYKKLLQLNSRK